MSEKDLEVKIGSLTFSHPIYNAAGPWAKSITDVENITSSASSAVLVGSITKDRRDGNEGRVYFQGKEFVINALGLPNLGMDYYEKNILPEMAKIIHKEDKLFGINVAGFDPVQYANLTLRAFLTGADFVEVNGGCPNVYDGENGKQHEIVCYDEELTDEVLSEVEKEVGEDANVFFKVSPLEPGKLKKIAAVVMRHKVVKAVVTSNTFPNASFEDSDGKDALSVGFGGFSGAAFLPIVRGQVKQWKREVGSNIKVIGVGGITNVEAGKMLLKDADMIQIASALMDGKLYLFDSILSKLV